MIRIAVLALPGCVPSGTLGCVDVFEAANAMEAIHGLPRRFEAVLRASGAGPVRGFHGMPIAGHEPLDGSGNFDVVIAPAVFGGVEEALSQRETTAWLERQHAAGAVVCGVCAGVFLLAEADLLDGREATTHWALADSFRLRYPGVDLRPELILSDQGDVVTAGGVTAYLDLCLHLVARLASPELASTCAKVLLVEPGRRSQIPYAQYMPRAHGDEAVLRAQDFLAANLRERVSLRQVADAAGLGERTLLRRFARATGRTPLEYLQRLRVESAKLLLETTGLGVEELAASAGYADPASFRRLFKSVTGLSPGAYRTRFRLP